MGWHKVSYAFGTGKSRDYVQMLWKKQGKMFNMKKTFGSSFLLNSGLKRFQIANLCYKYARIWDHILNICLFLEHINCLCHARPQWWSCIAGWQGHFYHLFSLLLNTFAKFSSTTSIRFPFCCNILQKNILCKLSTMDSHQQLYLCYETDPIKKAKGSILCPITCIALLTDNLQSNYLRAINISLFN